MAQQMANAKHTRNARDFWTFRARDSFNSPHFHYSAPALFNSSTISVWPSDLAMDNGDSPLLADSFMSRPGRDRSSLTTRTLPNIPKLK